MTARRLLLTAVLCLIASSASPAKPPNVVVILSDDQGWGDLSVNGNTNLATPQIDSLAKDGALLRYFYVSPVCAPTRAEFLTGRYYPRGGVYGTSAGAERLNLDEKTIAEVFRTAGYRTAAFGKWHNGGQSPYHPNARGFEEFFGFTQGHLGHYFDAAMDHNGAPARGDGYITDDLTSRAIRFIEAQRGSPFFAYVAYNTPHSPMQVPDRFYRKFAAADLALRGGDGDAEDLAHTRAALAMVENIDWNVGRLLQRLNTLGLAENTIVIYFSDNGPTGARWNGGLKGRKGTLDEGGIRSPLLIRWPGRIRPGTTVPQIAAAVDLLPTIADLADIRVSGTKPLDGRSLAPLLLGRPGTWVDRKLFAFRGRDEVSVRTQRFRLDAQGRLYDIEGDPGQQADVAGAHPQVAGELRRAAAAMGREVLGGAAGDDRPVPLGHVPRTELPAGDATMTGTVGRSNRFPNSSYFTGWTATDAAIAWDVEVMRPGEYEAVLYYTLPAADTGVALELAFRGERLVTIVNQGHDPPLVGAAEDRVPRQESYVKDFKPFTLGTIRLTAGRGPLTLRAPRIPGRQAPDVWSLALTRR